MKHAMGLAAAAIVLVGCAPSPPQPGASGPPGMPGYPDSFRQTEGPGEPLMPWPKVQAGVGPRDSEAELAIIWRGHELRERHPGATPSELAEMLARDDVWNQKARFVKSERRTVVIREALTPW